MPGISSAFATKNMRLEKRTCFTQIVKQADPKGQLGQVRFIDQLSSERKPLNAAFTALSHIEQMLSKRLSLILFEGRMRY